MKKDHILTDSTAISIVALIIGKAEFSKSQYKNLLTYIRNKKDKKAVEKILEEYYE